MTIVFTIFFVMVGLAVNAEKIVFQSPTAVMLLCFTIAGLVATVEVLNQQINQLKETIESDRITNARYGLEDFTLPDNHTTDTYTTDNHTDDFHRMEK